MSKKSVTVGEHIVEIYGHIEGLKREMCHIKDNHLRHLKEDVQSVRQELKEGQDKMNIKMDNQTKMIISGMGSILLLFVTMILKMFHIL